MCPLTGKFVQGTKELKHFFWKKRTVSTNSEKNTFKLFYTVSFMLFTLFQWLSIFVIIAVLLLTRITKVGDVIYYGYLFHIVFH